MASRVFSRLLPTASGLEVYYLTDEPELGGGESNSGHKKTGDRSVATPKRDWDKSVAGSSIIVNGRRDVQVVEPPDAIKTVLVRWNGVKTDLTKLAKLRWIDKLTTPEICGLVGQSRSAVRTSIRTIRKCGVSELNLTEDEKKIVEKQMKLEEAKYGDKYR